MPFMEKHRTRVLLITPTLHIGGLEQVVATLCRSIDREQFDPSVLCLRDRGPLAELIEDAGVPVLTLHPHAVEGADYWGFLIVARLVRKHAFKVIHTHNTPSLVFGGFGAILGGATRIIHTDHARLYPDKRRLIMAERLMSHWTDWVVGVSQETTDQLHKHVGISRRRLLTIPNGVDGKRYSVTIDRAAKLRSIGLQADRPLVLGVCARLTEQKGISFLLEAMPEILARHANAFLLVVGDGPCADQLKTLTNNLGIAPNVKFLGSREDVPELLQLFDVFVLPSIWEGLPMALLEAMAAGRAIVATDVGGVATAIEHGDSGLLIPPGSPNDIVNSVCSLLAVPEQRDILGRAALHVFVRQFSSDRMTRQYERLYLGLSPESD